MDAASLRPKQAHSQRRTPRNTSTTLQHVTTLPCVDELSDSAMSSWMNPCCLRTACLMICSSEGLGAGVISDLDLGSKRDHVVGDSRSV